LFYSKPEKGKKMINVLLFLAFVVAQTAFVDEDTLLEVQEYKFQRWMNQHQKAYPTQEEYHTRFQNFIVLSL
jgi:hypothetical protein